MRCGTCADYAAGMLTEPVRFQRRVRYHAGDGSYTEEWHDLPGAPRRAYVKPMSGYERVQFEAMTAGERVRLVTRYFAGPPSVPELDGGDTAASGDEYDGGADTVAGGLDEYDGGGGAFDPFTGPIREEDRVLIQGYGRGASWRAYNIRYIENVERKNLWLVFDVEGGVAT